MRRSRSSISFGTGASIRRWRARPGSGGALPPATPASAAVASCRRLGRPHDESVAHAPLHPPRFLRRVYRQGDASPALAFRYFKDGKVVNIKYRRASPAHTQFAVTAQASRLPSSLARLPQQKARASIVAHGATVRNRAGMSTTRFSGSPPAGTGCSTDWRLWRRTPRRCVDAAEPAQLQRQAAVPPAAPPERVLSGGRVAVCCRARWRLPGSFATCDCRCLGRWQSPSSSFPPPPHCAADHRRGRDGPAGIRAGWDRQRCVYS